MELLEVIEFADGILYRKDPYNHHGKSVAVMCAKIAGAMDGTFGAGDLDLLQQGARLHDVGKIFLEDVLLNYPRRLAKGEYARMQTHVSLGYDLLSSLGYDPGLCEIVRCHHEHWDGSGYPRTLAGEAIPPLARIVTIADVWDSLTNDRAYRKAYPFERALEGMNACARWFDPELLAVWLEIVRKDDR